MAANIPSVQPKGGLIFGIVTEGSDPSLAATHAELDSWITTENAPNTWVVENVASSADGTEKTFASGRDTYVVIDLATMKILSIDHNNEPTALANFKARLP